MIEIFQIAGFVLFNGIILLFAAGAVAQARARHEAAAVSGPAGTSVSDRSMMPAAGDRSPSRPLRSGVRSGQKVR